MLPRKHKTVHVSRQGSRDPAASRTRWLQRTDLPLVSFRQLLDDNPGYRIPSRGRVAFGVVGAGAHPDGYVNQACLHPLTHPFNCREETRFREQLHCLRTRDNVLESQSVTSELKSPRGTILKWPSAACLFKKKKKSLLLTVT